jgi:hypothetical protein
VNQVVSTESDIAFTQAMLAKTEVRAPFAGVVGLRNVSVGSTVDKSDVLVSVQQLDPLKLDFSLPRSTRGPSAWAHRCTSRSRGRPRGACDRRGDRTAHRCRDAQREGACG